MAIRNELICAKSKRTNNWLNEYDTIFRWKQMSKASGGHTKSFAIKLKNSNRRFSPEMGEQNQRRMHVHTIFIFIFAFSKSKWVRSAWANRIIIKLWLQFEAGFSKCLLSILELSCVNVMQELFGGFVVQISHEHYDRALNVLICFILPISHSPISGEFISKRTISNWKTF